MILTKDNLLNYVREQRYVLPATIAEHFETTTMIASAALSELAKDHLIGITHLKLASSPYYYDIRNKDSLIEIGEKHLSGYEKETFLMLQEKQVLNNASLTIPQKLGISRIEDFAKKLKIEHGERTYSFWVWYLRDSVETKKQLLDALSGSGSKQSTQTKKVVEPKAVNQGVKTTSSLKTSSTSHEKEKEEDFIENYLKEHYFKIESKNSTAQGLLYTAKIKINTMTLVFDCLYFPKKPTEADLISFYTSSLKPKIVFIKNPPKKFFTLAQRLENFIVVNI